jgi:hypothetical protein
LIGCGLRPVGFAGGEFGRGQRFLGGALALGQDAVGREVDAGIGIGQQLGDGGDRAAQCAQLTWREDGLALAGDDGHFARDQASGVEAPSTGKKTGIHMAGWQAIGTQQAAAVRDVGVHAHQVPRAQGQLGAGCRRKQAHRKVRQRQGDRALVVRWIWMRIRSLMMELSRLLKSSLPVITNWVSASSMDLNAPVTARSACLAALVAS